MVRNYEEKKPNVFPTSPSSTAQLHSFTPSSYSSPPPAAQGIGLRSACGSSSLLLLPHAFSSSWLGSSAAFRINLLLHSSPRAAAPSGSIRLLHCGILHRLQWWLGLFFFIRLLDTATAPPCSPPPHIAGQCLLWQLEQLFSFLLRCHCCSLGHLTLLLLPLASFLPLTTAVQRFAPP